MSLKTETIALKMLLKIPIFLMLYLTKSHAVITLQILRKTCRNTGFLWPVFKDILFVYKDRNFDSVFMRENTGQRKLIFYHSLRSDDDELIVSVGWLTHEQSVAAFPEGSIIRKPHYHDLPTHRGGNGTRISETGICIATITPRCHRISKYRWFAHYSWLMFRYWHNNF